jgi:Tol biopolymer transport system component
LADGEAASRSDIALWVISTLAGEVRKLADDGVQGAFAPDGSQIAFWKNEKYWLMNPSGQEIREFMSLDNSYEFRGPKWSPDGKRLLYLKNKFGSDEGSIEARNVMDGNTAVLFSGKGLRDFWWTADGRLIYAQTGTPEEATNDLWDVRIDEKSARRVGEPRRLTRWVGYSPGFISVSANGKRILTTKGYTQSDIYVAEVDTGGHNIESEQRLTLDTHSDWPSAWTTDGKAIMFFSDRNGPFSLFSQGQSVQDAEVIVRGNDDSRSPQISPDGQWLLYMQWPDLKHPRPVRIMRQRSGGTADLVLEARGAFASGVTFSTSGEQDARMKGPKAYPDFRCPSLKSAQCILAEAAQDEIVFTFFDPRTGRGDEVARVHTSPSRFFWGLSPDGSQLAYGEFRNMANDHVSLLDVKNRETHEVPLADRTALSSLSWSADGRYLFVTTTRREGSDLLHVSLDGKVDLLREETGRWLADPRPSPDGRLLALSVRTTDSNVWLLETK